MPEDAGQAEAVERQSNTLDCDRCGAKGELGMGYGEQSAVECPDCGDTWVVE